MECGCFSQNVVHCAQGGYLFGIRIISDPVSDNSNEPSCSTLFGWPDKSCQRSFQGLKFRSKNNDFRYHTLVVHLNGLSLGVNSTPNGNSPHLSVHGTTHLSREGRNPLDPWIFPR